MRLSSKHLSVVGLLLFMLILSRIDVYTTLWIIAGLNPVYILACLLSVAIEVLIRALRWKILVNQFTKGYSLPDSIQTFIMGVAFGAVTPGRVGDIIKAFDIRDRGVELKRALSIEILDRLLDFFYLFLAAAAGYLFLIVVASGLNYNLLLIVLVVLLLSSFTCLMFSTSSVRRMLKPIHRLLVPGRFKDQSKQLFEVFQDTLSIIRRPYLFLEIVLLTACWWTVLFLRPYILGVGIGLELNPLVFLFAMPVVLVIEILPVSLLGIGTRDAGLIAVFSLLGVPAETMVAVSLMMLFLSILPQVIAGYFIAYKKGVSLNLFTENAPDG
jgi:uncharacterized protein (TIRG00374 family)